MKRKLIGILLLTLLIIPVFTACSSVKVSESDFTKRGIVIDAGHGGSDPGAISTINEVREDGLNLAIAQYVESELASSRVKTIMTRENDDALAPTKADDMSARRNTIYSSGAALMVSIHMNSFPSDPSCFGPQVFYQKGSDSGKQLAQKIQVRLNELTGGTRDVREDSLYVLNGNSMPSVLVECGFLTNESDADKLTQPEYQKQIAHAIVLGLYDYLA